MREEAFSIAEDLLCQIVMTRIAYKSDLNDREWRLIEPLIPPPKPGGHPRTVDMREVVNAIFYLQYISAQKNKNPAVNGGYLLERGIFLTEAIFIFQASFKNWLFVGDAS